MTDKAVEKVLVGTRVSRETQLVLKMMAAKNNHSMAEELRNTIDKHVASFKEEVGVAL